jgi:hypothetical protein
MISQVIRYLLKVAAGLVLFGFLTRSIAEYYHLAPPPWGICFTALMLLDYIGKALRGEFTKVDE